MGRRNRITPTFFQAAGSQQRPIGVRDLEGAGKLAAPDARAEVVRRGAQQCLPVQ